MNSRKIPVLYTTYDRLYYTKRTLPALIRNSGDIAEIYVIDNGSKDGTAEYLKENFSDKLNITFNDENLGIAGAMNQFFGMIPEGSKFFGKVDNDTLVPKNWLSDLLFILEAHDLDFVQAKHKISEPKFKDWSSFIKEKSFSIDEFPGYRLAHSYYVGGSGIVGRVKKVGKIPETKDKLYGWARFMHEKALSSKGRLKCAFCDGIDVDLLDMESDNVFSREDLGYKIRTGRVNQNTVPNVSIIIPVIRPDSAKKTTDLIKQNANYPEDKYEIVTLYDEDRIGCPKMVKKLVGLASHDLIMFLGDDTRPKPNFLINAVSRMKMLPASWGLVGLNDSVHSGKKFATHWLADKRLLNYLEDGEFFYTGYKHTYCDLELTDRAKELGRYAYAEDSVLEHDHPIVSGEELDDDYRRAYSREWVDHDRMLYLQRRKDRDSIKLAIGFPLTDVKVYTSFLASWTLMQKPDFTFLMPGDRGPVETMRNNLVRQAIKENCTHLLMMDTDQNYPPDTIPKLLSHNKDVVAGIVHRRYPPFDPILYRGKLGAYRHISDDECFSGELVEVDATGCACILYDMDVFHKIPYPWFELDRTGDGRLIGEDIGFCAKLKAAGFRIFVDTSVVIGHISTVEITRDFYLLYKKVKGFEWNQPDESNGNPA